nr:MAG TPA: hypothetical protein [Caudoviricetes sp.]
MIETITPPVTCEAIITIYYQASRGLHPIFQVAKNCHFTAYNAILYHEFWKYLVKYPGVGYG